VVIVISNMVVKLFLLGVLLELGTLFVPFLWRRRRYLLLLVVPTIGSWTGVLLMESSHLLGLILATLSVYRLFNLLKLSLGRINGPYLSVSVRRTSLVLCGLQAAVYAGIGADIQLTSQEGLLILACLQFLGGITVFAVTARNIFKTRHHTTKHFYSDKELPSVTVAIPARNETNELSACIRAVLANDYPKLEVLVLDDCSQDRTPEIIKDFAQDGVRFLQGTPPADGWLAKNHAYNQLAQAASGQYILFCGVDVRLGPSTVRSLVTTLLNKKRSMISVLPLRVGGGVKTAFIQPMRYWWELALPRRIFNRPPVLSTLWIVSRKTLEQLGGFSAVRRSILPETVFARELVKSDDYAFTRADDELDVRTIKSVHAQLNTAIRTRYPQLRRRPENVFLLAVLEILMFLGPFLFVINGLLHGFGLMQWLALLTGILLVASHYQIMAISNPANSMIALVNFPVAVITEIILLHVSMYRYEFSTVEWRGRNVCIPVMRVVSHLPPMTKRMQV
jgi:glycosyltransferase involved in cell wall biosynthesis